MATYAEQNAAVPYIARLQNVMDGLRFALNDGVLQASCDIDMLSAAADFMEASIAMLGHAKTGVADAEVNALVVANTTTIVDASTLADLPAGVIGSEYTGSVSVPGDNTATFTVTGGSLPDGLTLASNGAVSGIPEVADTFRFTVTATTAGGTSAHEYGILIAAYASTQNYEAVQADEYATATTSPWISTEGALGSIAVRVTATPGATGLATSAGVVVERASDGSGTGAETYDSDACDVSGSHLFNVTPGAKTWIRVTITPQEGTSVVAAATIAWPTAGA